MVCYGDSITANSEQESYVNELQRLLKDDWLVLGSGVNGEIALEALSRVQTDVSLSKPEVALICYGHNEVHRRFPVKEYEQALLELIETLGRSGCQVVLMTPTQINNKEVALLYQPYLSVLEGISQKKQVPLIWLWEVFASHDLDVIFTYRFDDDGMFGVDYLHPNLSGQKIIGQRVFSELMSHILLGR